MDLGRFSFIALIAAIAAIGLAGCGDDKAAQSSTDPKFQEAITATEPTGESSGSKEGEKGSGAGSSSDDSDGKSGSSDSKDDRGSSKKSKSKSDGGGSGNTPEAIARGTEVPAEVKRELTIAWNRLLKAMNDGDVDYVCGTAYSSDYLAELNSKGGCEKVTEAGLASVEGFTGPIRGINLINPNLGEVYVTLTRKTSGKDVTSEPAIHFKKQNGQWKRFIYTGENG